MAVEVPIPIYEKLCRLQALTDEESARWGDRIDWKRVHDQMRNRVLEIFWRVNEDFRFEEGWLEAGSRGKSLPGTVTRPRPTNLQEGKDALWSYFGGESPGPGRRAEMAGFLVDEFESLSEQAGGDRRQALEALATSRGKTLTTMRAQLHKLGVKNLPILDKGRLSGSGKK